MRRHLVCLCIATWLLAPIALHAQDKPGDIPARYRAIASGRIRLERILGTPELPTLFGPGGALSADGKQAVYVDADYLDLYSMGAARSRLLVGTPKSMKWPREIDVPGKCVTALHLSADGGKVLLGGVIRLEKNMRLSAFLSLWDLDTGKEIKAILYGEGPATELVTSVALADDEETALAAMQGVVKCWNIKTGRLLASVKTKGHLGSVAYLPGGKQFLATMPQGQIHLFDAKTAKPVKAYQASTSTQLSIWQIALSASGKRFVVGDFHSSAPLTLLDTASGKEINALRQEKTEGSPLTAACLAPDNKTVVLTRARFIPTDENGEITLSAWDGEANKILWSHVVPYRGQFPMRIVGDKLLIGGGPNLFEVWDWKQGKKLQTWGGHKGAVNAVAALQDGSMLSAGQDGAILRWRDGLLVGRTAAEQGAIVGLAVSGDKKHWLTAGSDQTIKLWRDSDAKPMQTLKGHAGSITSVAFDHTGKIGVTGSGDRTAKTWDLASGKEIASFAGHSEGVNAVAISPDNRWLATGSDDTTIRVWPIKDGKPDPSREAILLEKHTKPVTCLQFTADGKTLLSGSQDQKLMAWDWRKGSMDFITGGHKNWINAIALLDAKTVLTSSDDLSVCVWDLATGMEIGRVDFGVVGDCPRCLTRLGPDRFAVGTSSWMVYEFQLAAGKSKGGGGSSNK